MTEPRWRALLPRSLTARLVTGVVALVLVVVALVYALGTREYLGLGVWSPNPADATIPGFFEPSRVDHWSWLLKIVFTVVTLSAGFKGGAAVYAVGGGAEMALSGPLSLRGDLQILGPWGAMPSTGRATVGLLWHMN